VTTTVVVSPPRWSVSVTVSAGGSPAIALDGSAPLALASPSRPCMDAAEAEAAVSGA
jgi:hypothetical protein